VVKRDGNKLIISDSAVPLSVVQCATCVFLSGRVTPSLHVRVMALVERLTAIGTHETGGGVCHVGRRRQQHRVSIQPFVFYAVWRATIVDSVVGTAEEGI